MTSDVKMQNLLNDVTEALLAGDNIDSVRGQYDVPRAESEELIDLIERINRSMVRVEPAPQFEKRLKADLLGERRAGVVWRIRKLPARVQVAAAAAIMGGFLLILRRLFLGEDSRRTQEDTSALQEKY